MILILEDSADRITAFCAVLAELAPSARVQIWTTAIAMIQEAPVLLPSARLICLDHDLYVPKGDPDPGDGLDVAKFLVSQPTVRPVIIHSSNSDRAAMMQGEFDLDDWPCTRVLPFGDNWISEDWRSEVRRVLNEHAGSYAP